MTKVSSGLLSALSNNFLLSLNGEFNLRVLNVMPENGFG